MSFVNLLGSDVWSEADIVNRTEAMIHAEFPVEQEGIINRIVTAAAAGMYALTEEEEAQVERYNQVCLDARAAGVAARADNERLVQVLAYEHALAAAAAAQMVIDAVTEDVLALASTRASQSSQ